MQVLDDVGALVRLGRWALALAHHDTRYPSPVPDNRKFMSARDAVRLIGDDAVVATSGLGAHQRPSILYWALRARFAETGHPRRLTLMNIGGQGGRGLLPGTIDELAQPGLCARVVSSHFETNRRLLELAADGHCELQCIPLGVMAQLYRSLGRGVDSLRTDIGVGTFVDPRVGRGSPVRSGRREQLVSVDRQRLRFRIPKVDVAIFNLPAADRRGNLYAKHCAIIGDAHELARAARRNRGKVIANVGLLVDEGYDRVFMPASAVDAVVYHPDTEQTAGFFHRDPWLALTPGGAGPIGEALHLARLARWLGEIGGGLAERGSVDEAIYRLAATTLMTETGRRAVVAIGAGHPEEVGRIVFEAGRLEDVTLLVESGAVGGLPAPGAYFGAAFAPREIISTAQLFDRCARRLDAACLGALEVDSAGNVNVSRRGAGLRHYAGPGGFIDFTVLAETIIFVLGWMRGGEIAAEDGAIHIRQRGAPKFVRRVSEVTFNGQAALRAGKRVFYATPVGLFRLTRRGVELTDVMPGIDVRSDVLARSPMRIVLPSSGAPNRLPASIVTGQGFSLPTGRGGTALQRRRR
jgi:propionate CoA-transferase